jgi:hypothetical protein
LVNHPRHRQSGSFCQNGVRTAVEGSPDEGRVSLKLESRATEIVELPSFGLPN